MSSPEPGLKTEQMHGELKDYRQPMVTSLGILLGFMLNFIAGWGIRTGQPVQDKADAVILTTCCVAVLLMLCTIYRILNADVNDRDLTRYYRFTLRMYISGISLAFMGFALGILL